MYPRLRDLREDHDMTQEQLARKLSMSQTGYSRYEIGKSDVPTCILLELANLYHTSVDYLLGNTDERKPYPKAGKRGNCQ